MSAQATARTAAVECALRCFDQRVRGHHRLLLSEIHRIYAGEFALSPDGKRTLAEALEHASARADRKAA